MIQEVHTDRVHVVVVFKLTRRPVHERAARPPACGGLMYDYRTDVVWSFSSTKIRKHLFWD